MTGHKSSRANDASLIDATSLQGRALLSEAVRYLAEVCDGAYRRDSKGYNAVDTGLGHRLAAMPAQDWSDEHIWAAHNIVGKYRDQLLIAGLDITMLARRPAAIQPKTRWRDLFPKPNLPLGQLSAPKKDQFTVSKVEGNAGVEELAVHFAYNPVMLDDLKETFSVRRWVGEKKAWHLPYRPDVALKLKSFVEKWIADVAQRDLWLAVLWLCLDDMDKRGIEATPVEAPPAPLTFTLEGDMALLALLYSDDLWYRVKSMAGAFRDKEHEVTGSQLKRWYVPITAATVVELASLATDMLIVIPDDLRERMLDVLDKTRRVRAMSRAVSPQEAELDPTEINALAEPLRPFQQVAVHFVEAQERVLIGDEMGLGKSVEALIGARAAHARRMLIICPASFKYGWLGEIEKWAPSLSPHAVALSGKPSKALLGELYKMVQARKSGKSVPLLSEEASRYTALAGDEIIAVVNYDILTYWMPILLYLDLDCIVADEAHKLIHPETAWTQAANALARGTNGVKEISKPVRILIALTGTPLPNRVRELYPIIDFLGQSHIFGGEGRWLFRYCDPIDTGHGWSFDGASNTEELRELLRSTVMIRRETGDVVDELPELVRVELPVDIANSAEYKKALKETIDFLKARRREKAINDRKFADSIANLPEDEKKRRVAARIAETDRNTERSEAIVKMNELMGLAEVGKLKPAQEWIDNFLAANPDRKLLVFATRRQMQAELVWKYPGALHILEGDSLTARHAAQLAFQSDPSKRLMILSGAAKEGVTLTAADTILFTGLWWRPSDHDQAEHRIYRINDLHAGTAVYMLGRDTIDQDTMRLLERKRSVAHQVLDGKSLADEDADDVLGELLAQLLATNTETSPTQKRRTTGKTAASGSNSISELREVDHHGN